VSRLGTGSEGLGMQDLEANAKLRYSAILEAESGVVPKSGKEWGGFILQRQT